MIFDCPDFQPGLQETLKSEYFMPWPIVKLAISSDFKDVEIHCIGKSLIDFNMSGSIKKYPGRGSWDLVRGALAVEIPLCQIE